MRRIKKAKIKFISLVPRGANRLKTIFKDDGAFEVQLLFKDLSELGELTAVVYAPELRDSQGDIASAEVIKDMLYSSAKEGVDIDIRHDGKALTKDQVYVAERFLVQKGDPRFEGLTDYDGAAVDPTGAWGVVLKIDDPELRQLYREGKWDGVSMGGDGHVVQEKEDTDDLADKIVGRLAKKLNTKEEDTMTPEQIQELAKATATAVVTAMKKAETPPTPPKNPETPPVEAPVFKGDPTSAEDIKAHKLALEKHELLTKVDWSDPKAVAALIKDDPPTEPKSDDLQAAEAELAKAQAKIKKLQGASNQGAGAPPADNDASGSKLEGDVLTKEDKACALIGSNMAKWANGQRAR